MEGADELERVYREEATRIRASLAARLGDVGLAEEVVQDAFIEALEHWGADGVPPNPGGWLATTEQICAAPAPRPPSAVTPQDW